MPATAALSASPTLRGLPERWLTTLARAAAAVTVEPGDELATEDPPTLYFLVAGEVAAATPPDAEGVSEVLGHEGPGSVFGSGALTGEEDVPVYRAVGSGELYAWELPDLERLFSAADGLRRQLETRVSLRRRRTELVDLLRRTSLFRQASQSLIRWLVALSTLVRFEAGEMVCREGEDGDSMFLIVSGEVEITQAGATEPLQQLHRGDFFGEIALIQGSPRIASATAVSTCDVLVVHRDTFETLYRRSASFRHAVRLTAELRLEANVARRAEPELIWLVDGTARPVEQLARLVADALREEVGEVPDPTRVGAPADVDVALEAGRRGGAAYVLCCSDAAAAGDAVARHVADRAGAVVHVTETAAAALPLAAAGVHRVHHVVVSPERGDTVRHDAFALHLDSDLAEAPFAAVPSGTRDELARIARALSHRRVGVALGGGAAWGYAHVALLRGLARAGIPVDLLVGVSVGSLVGAFYASQGLDGLERLVDAKLELGAAAVAAIGTTSSVGLFLRRHVPEARVEELPLPFATVAVDANTGREKVFRHGPLAAAVRASCSLPGVFGRPLFGGHRYLDACVRNNVPVSYCTEADVDFVVACDVVPAPKASRNMHSGLRALALEVLQVNRVTDTIRSLYWLASDSGRAQAGLADALFAPDLSDFFPWDFHRADAIVERAEEEIDDFLLAAQGRYRALTRAGRIDG